MLIAAATGGCDREVTTWTLRLLLVLFWGPAMRANASPIPRKQTAPRQYLKATPAVGIYGRRTVMKPSDLPSYRRNLSQPVQPQYASTEYGFHALPAIFVGS